MIAFLFDADLDSGLGHFNRCQNLAKIFLKNNHKCLFIVFKDNEYKFPKVNNLIKKYFLNYSDKTLNKVKKILSTQKIKKLVIDTYRVKKDIPNFKGIEVVHISDFYQKKTNANITINPGLIDLEYLKKIKSRYSESYYGSKYSLVDRNFLKFRKKSLNEKFILKNNVLIFFGAFKESVAYLSKFLKILNNSIFRKFNFTVIFGSKTLYKDFFKNSEAKFSKNFHFISHTKKIYKYIYENNFIISGCGLINHEKICIGKNSISLIFAKNQKESVKYFKNKIFFKSIRSNIFLKKNASDIESIISKGLKVHDKNIFSINDGLGAKRIYRLIQKKEGLKLKIRKSNIKDKFIYFNWVNDLLVRKNSIKSSNIKFQEHDNWYEKKLKDSSNYFFLCCDENKLPLGQIRYDFDKKNKKYFIDISVDECARNLGLGSYLISETLKKINKKIKLNKLFSTIKNTNKKSQAIFIKNNFKEIKKNKKMTTFKYSHEQ